MDYKHEIAKLIDGVEAQSLIPCKDPLHGDWALPCFKFAAEKRMPPQRIAEQFAAEINVALPPFLSAVSAVAGYLNFTLNKCEFAKLITSKILKQGTKYGGSNRGRGSTVCIDYSSINIAKPFHIGHLLTTVLGASLYRVYKKLGYKVVGINHLGDWGTQFGKLIVAYKKWGSKQDAAARGVRSFLEIYVKFHDEAERDPSLNDEARAWFKKIEDGDKEAVKLFKFFKDITLKEVGKTYKRLGVKFDSNKGESFFNDKMAPVIEELRGKGLLTKSEGAEVVKFEGDVMPPCLILRSDGASLYATRDLAAAFYRKKTYDFAKCLYVVAYQQNLHFKQVFKVVEMMGHGWAKDMVHVAFGMVSLEGGSLSTRKGQVVFLDEVLDKAEQKALAIIREKTPDLEDKQAVAAKIGIGAVVFSVLHNNRIKDIEFSYDRALNFDGETAPYVQYTVARCNSVLAKTEEKVSAIEDYEGILNAEGDEVVRLLSRYPEIIEAAADKYEPGLLARFAVDLAQAYNKFYFEHRILNAAPRQRAARIALTKCVKTVLTDALGLLGINCPEKM